MSHSQTVKLFCILMQLCHHLHSTDTLYLCCKCRWLSHVSRDVNETETETLAFSPRRDRDLSKVRLETSGDRDFKTETASLQVRCGSFHSSRLVLLVSVRADTDDSNLQQTAYLRAFCSLIVCLPMCSVYMTLNISLYCVCLCELLCIVRT